MYDNEKKNNENRRNKMKIKPLKPQDIFDEDIRVSIVQTLNNFPLST